MSDPYAADETWDDDRQEPAEVWAESYVSVAHDPVVIICDATLPRRTRFSLYVKYGRLPRRIACPVCGRRARVELDAAADDVPDYDPGPGWVARSWAHLSYPFRWGGETGERGEQPRVRTRQGAS